MTTPDSQEHLQILFFANLREIVGERHLLITLDRPNTVGAIMDRLVAHYPELGPYRNIVRAAVNQEYVDEAFTVFNGDELAIITPVSGG